MQDETVQWQEMTSRNDLTRPFSVLANDHPTESPAVSFSAIHTTPLFFFFFFFFFFFTHLGVLRVSTLDEPVTLCALQLALAVNP